MNVESSHPEHDREPSPSDEQLVSYLDGELDEGTARRIETLVADDPELRRRLSELSSVWDMLDELGRAKTEENFTETTLELVALKAEEDAEQQQAKVPLLLRRRRIFLGAILLGFAVAGFLAVALLRPDENRRLVKDLPVIENVDVYLQMLNGEDQIDSSIDFLRRLNQEQLFEISDPLPEVAVEEDWDRRREQIEQLTPAEKADLSQKRDRFEGLTAEKRELLRSLDRHLKEDTDGESLRRVMHAYCEWLDSLIPYARNDLESLPVEKRIVGIKEKRYQSQDDRAIREWGTAHFQKLGLSPRTLMQDLWRQMRSQENIRRKMHSRDEAAALLVKYFRLEKADFGSLRDQLSPATRKQFDKRSDAGQRRWVAGKLIEGMRPTMPPVVVSDEQLEDFFKSDALSDEDREQLLKLPGNEMYRQLLQRYRRLHSPRRQPRGPGRNQSGWRRNSGRFGPRGNPPPDKDSPGTNRQNRRKRSDLQSREPQKPSEQNGAFQQTKKRRKSTKKPIQTDKIDANQPSFNDETL